MRPWCPCAFRWWRLLRLFAILKRVSRAVDSTLSTAESYTCIPEGRISKLCDALTCTASRWALLTIVPIPTGLLRPSGGADVTLIAFRFPVYPCWFNMSMIVCLWVVGSRTPMRAVGEINARISIATLSVCSRT